MYHDHRRPGALVEVMHGQTITIKVMTGKRIERSPELFVGQIHVELDYKAGASALLCRPCRGILAAAMSPRRSANDPQITPRLDGRRWRFVLAITLFILGIGYITYAGALYASNDG